MNTTKGLLLVAVVALVVVGCPDPGEVPPATEIPYTISGSVFQNGVEIEVLNNVRQSTDVEMSGPGLVVLDFQAKNPTTRPIYWVDTTLEIYYKDEFGSKVLWVSLTEEGPVIMPDKSVEEKSAEELALLALVFLVGAVHVEGGVADCVDGAYPAVTTAQGWGFQVEVPFSPAVKSVAAMVTLKDGLGAGAKKFTHTVNLLGPTPAIPTPVPFAVNIVKPNDGAALTEGKPQLFVAEAEGADEVSSWFWLFPDETVSSGSQVVAKMVHRGLSGEVSVIGTTPDGRVGWDTIMVTSSPGGEEPEPETRGVEITSPAPGSTVSGDSIHFHATLLGNEQPKTVEWYASEGYHDNNRLDFSIPASTFGLGAGTWSLWVKVLVTFADGKTFKDEITFDLKVEEPTKPLFAKIVAPAEGAVLPLNQEIAFKAEVSGGVAPLSIHWKFPDNDHRYNALSVVKIFAIPDSEGYVYFEVKDATGASYKTQWLVRTAAS
ncbi:MAG TPA: hypothetical protein PLS91_00360 [Candidatus Paceibacterota bacterium]|nr:hypothetical protein [Candidatus Paceibacterota bacterium]